MQTKQIVSNVALIVGDVALTVGACIGVGVASGKEPLLLVGKNFFLFAATFIVGATLVRKYCHERKITDVATFCKNCFGKLSAVACTVFAACNAVCISAMTICAEKCLSQLFALTDLPIYAVCLCVCATMLAKSNLNTLRLFNGLGVILCVAWLIFATQNNVDSVTDQPNVSPAATALYATFSVMMSLSIHAKNAQRQGSHLIAILASATILCGIFAMVSLCATSNGNFPTLSAKTPVGAKILAGVAVFLTTVSSLACNVLPISALTADIIPSKTLRIACIFCVTTALSVIGADSLMTYGYTIAGLLGVATLVSVAWQLIDSCVQRRKSTKIDCKQLKTTKVNNFRQ